MKKFKLKIWQWDFITLAIGLAILLLICFGVSEARAWNVALFDTTWHFDRAIISLPDPAGKFGDYFYVEGNVDSWQDFENSDMIQVKIDGVTYLTHSSNVVLISE